MRRWRRVNQGLALIVLVLALAALVRVGFTLYSDHAIQPERTVTRTAALSARPSDDLRLTLKHYRTGHDFLDRPALVVTYELRNRAGQAALPSYVFDRQVQLQQQTQTGLTGELAGTRLAAGQLSPLEVNYVENGQIRLLAGQTVQAIAVYRLGSLNLPVTVQIAGQKSRVLQPWTLKAVTQDG
ncbi:DUF5067 domain-containing protein [Lacticaseibacillus absianus]|uniref:DUF5067 domain-containing protein n=1 Tax=Lacticaseibacillus absianus TaxID=2729623 RepID=UPI0015C95E55|nr:DUF5067 domain-containing protein [Lacticaseibacillus absianus]